MLLSTRSRPSRRGDPADAARARTGRDAPAESDFHRRIGQMVQADRRGPRRLWSTVAIFATLLVLCYQCSTWASVGYWPSITVATVWYHFNLARPYVSWDVVQAGVDWMMNLSIVAFGWLCFTSLFLVSR